MLFYEVSKMNSTEILLSSYTNEDEKRQAVNDIIETYDVPLTPEQVSVSFTVLRSNLNELPLFLRSAYLHECYNFALHNLLIVNKNMYIAIILALNDDCGKFTPYGLMHFVGKPTSTMIFLPLGRCWNYLNPHHITLLEYYDFDISNFTVDPEYLRDFQKHRDERYGGKLTKSAIKK